MELNVQTSHGKASAYAYTGGKAFDARLPCIVFIHGALCVSWSGQCRTSEAWGGRSANRGQCAQSCRLPYDLLVDGEELAGAKQNRVLNTSILVKENSEILIPVSCTEQGRWAYASAAFADSGVVMASQVRKNKARSVSENLKAAAAGEHEEWTELFDLRADPYETRNLYRDPAHAGLRTQLEAEHARQAREVGYLIPDYVDKPEDALPERTVLNA